MSTLSLNISVNSKLFVKTLKGVKQWPRGRCLTKKPEVKNLVRQSPFRSAEYEVSAQEGRRGDGRGRVLYLVWKTPRKNEAP